MEGERLVRKAVADDGAAVEVFRTKGHIVDRRTLDGTETKTVLLLSHPKSPGSWSSEDPVDLLLVEKGSSRPITGPWGPRLSIAEAAQSPGGRFLALSEWRDRTDQKVGRYQVIHILDLRTNQAKTLHEENVSLNPGSWVGDEGRPRLLVADGFRFDKRPLKYRLVEPESGAGTPAPAPEDSSNQSIPAPDGGSSFRVVPGKHLEFVKRGSPVLRFEFHEEDARLAEDECCEWVSPRYVYFRGPRPAFIDRTNGKMNFPAPMKPELGLLSFSRDFRRVLSRREDGLWLGDVSSP